MTKVLICGLSALALCVTSVAQAGQITGEYIESRSCDVYTGPCFANGQIGQAGREAVLAWKVDKGSWNGVDLSGLSAVLVLNANDTLGFNPSFAVNPFPVKSVVLVDEKATSEQREALVAFVKSLTPKLSDQILKVQTSPISLVNDHLSGKGKLVAGELVRSFRQDARGAPIAHFRYDRSARRWVALQALRPTPSGTAAEAVDALLQAPVSPP